MKTLILGGTGFVGSRLIDLYEKKNKEVIIYKRKELDLLSPNSISKVLGRIGNEPIRVIFLSSINRTVNDSDIAFDMNISMVRNFINFSKDLNVKGLVYTSTVDVYGSRINTIIDENFHINPSSGYGLSKFCCESLFKIQNARYPTAILRLPGVYGNYENDNSVIGNFISAAKSNNLIRISGNGDNLRDYIHVDDVINILEKISELDYDGILNLVTGYSNTINSIINLIIKKLNYSVQIKYDEDNSRFFNLFFNNKNLINITGNYNFKKIEEGINSYFEK